MESERVYFRRHRPSFFFPILLITVGIVWLLVNNGTIPTENLYRMVPFWPVLIILAGLGILLRQIWWPLNGLMWLAAAGAFLWAVITSPAFLPQVSGMEVKQERFREPVGSATSASVNLDLSVSRTRVFGLSGSSDLIDAQVSYLGSITFDVSGGSAKSVRLDENIIDPINLINFGRSAVELKPWEIGLTPDIPLRLRVNGGTGSTELDLSALELESLSIDGGTGSLTVNLPANSASYPFSMDIGTGSVRITAPEGASFDLNSEGGTGSLTIDVPDNAGVQVEVRDGGLGSLNLPAGYDRVRGQSDDDEGVWENDAYASSKSPIKIVLDIGTGSVTIR